MFPTCQFGYPVLVHSQQSKNDDNLVDSLKYETLAGTNTLVDHSAQATSGASPTKLLSRIMNHKIYKMLDLSGFFSLLYFIFTIYKNLICSTNW